MSDTKNGDGYFVSVSPEVSRAVQAAFHGGIPQVGDLVQFVCVRSDAERIDLKLQVVGGTAPAQAEDR